MTLTKYLRRPGNSQAKLAKTVGCSQGLISRYVAWLDGRRDRFAQRPSGERAIQIERATGGAVTRHALRPDLFGRSRRRAA